MSQAKIDITRYTPELEKLAAQLKARHDLKLETEKLCSAGYEVLQELANSGEYDCERGEFWAWAYKRVLRRMIDEVVSHGDYNRSQLRARRAKLAVRVSAWSTAEATNRDKFMDSNRDRFTPRWAMMYGTAVGYQLEIEAEEALSPEGELLASERRGFDAAEIARLRAALKRLPERQRKMLIQRYVEDEPLNSVATANGISKSRASHLLKAAREQLRRAVEGATAP